MKEVHGQVYKARKRGGRKDAPSVWDAQKKSKRSPSKSDRLARHVGGSKV